MAKECQKPARVGSVASVFFNLAITPKETDMSDVQVIGTVPAAYLNEISAAAYLGLRSARALRNKRWLGTGPCFVKVGRHVLYRISDLEDWLRERGRLKRRTSEDGVPLN